MMDESTQVAFKRIDDLSRRIAALEAAARPKPVQPYIPEAGTLNDVAEEMNSGYWMFEYEKCREEYYAAINERDQQAERASGLEKELGSVREQLRTMTERVEKAEQERDEEKQTACNLQTENQRLETLVRRNQAASDTLERLRKGEEVHLNNPTGGATAYWKLVLSGTTWDQRYMMLLSERDALAAKVAMLTDAAERERMHLEMKVHELERRLAEATRKYATIEDFSAIRRDAERWRWAKKNGLSDWFEESVVDASIAAEKEAKP